MTELRKKFEEWWQIKQDNTPLPPQLKEMFWLAFADGYSKGKKDEKEVDD